MYSMPISPQFLRVWLLLRPTTSLSLPADSLGMKQHPQQKKKELRSSCYHLDIHKFVGSLGMHPRMFRELTGQPLLSPWKEDGANTLRSHS